MKQFFDHIRKKFGSLSQTQVDGIKAIIVSWGRYGDGDDRKLAYALATAKWETGHKFKPVQENLNYTTAARIRAVWPSRFKSNSAAQPYVKNPKKLANKVYGGRLGNTGANDGWTYRGRGLVQITGKENYRKMGNRLGMDLVGNPELAAGNLNVAADILIVGMVEGIYTGKKLSDYIGAKKDYRQARRIINRLDKASQIADIAETFENALLQTDTRPEPPKPKPPEAEPWYVSLIRAIFSMFKK